MAVTAPHDGSGTRSAYEQRGWCAAPFELEPELLASVRSRVEAISRTARPEVVYEEGSDTVRALHGCHRYDEVCAALVRHPAVVRLAEELVGEPVYLYQFKVNIKGPREGQEWPWHQDFAFWAHEDGMPEPRAVNIAVNLDEVHPANGPLTVLSGSHRLGLVGDGAAESGDDWRSHVSARLTHTVPEEVARALAVEHPPRQVLGGAGAVTAFHPSIVHASSNNTSADRRAVLFLTYNAATNAPAHPKRPAFLVERDTTPVRAAVHTG
ncbi:phytanoyl-CoA dioxygenase [Streptomyces lonarensis]|uniref:Phytanoyl-CoA dioxygenase n=1 Tax=Streptomyces lonarensis TaxID=700599 RepID=A0A7X6D3E8_9ACTN|nr:phytanoyl-CoA dioxygenase [Streptomyces lonarensis]